MEEGVPITSNAGGRAVCVNPTPKRYAYDDVSVQHLRLHPIGVPCVWCGASYLVFVCAEMEAPRGTWRVVTPAECEITK